MKLMGRIVYIGSSSNVLARIGSHKYSSFKAYDEVVILWAPKNRIRKIESDLIKLIRPKLNLSNEKQVLCVSTGEKFRSLSEAALRFSVGASVIRSCILYNRTHKGLSFKFIKTAKNS